jgi:hypothetical protein
MRLLGFANQLVSVRLRHLSPPHHELDDVANALDGEAG